MELEGYGLALHHMSSLPHFSVGGATAAATPGSELELGALPSAVAGVEIVGT